MATKIKSHRIEDGNVTLKHLDPLIKIPEKQLELNYPTHTNEADLTLEQKNTMTLGGNADHLHHHAGGGGGVQGIYTNEERDAQLLRLAMMVNSDLFGLDQAIVDNYNDDSGVYRGYNYAEAPTLECLTDNASFPGSLESDTEYSYGVSYKNKYGQTNVVKVGAAVTGSGYTNAMRIQLDDVPIDNKGAAIYRTKGTTELLLVDEKDQKWENPNGLKIDEYVNDKTSGVSSTAITMDKSVDEAQEYISKSMSAVPDVSQPLGSSVPVDVPFDFFLISQSRTSAYELEILWDLIPSYAPRDYEVYYTTDTQVTDFENANWKKFDVLLPKQTTFKVPASHATNGTVEGNYRVINNTNPENKFHINPVEGITYLRIRVTRIDNLCRLRQVNMLGAMRSQNRHLFLDTMGIDFTPFNTIKFDYKTSGYQIPFQVEASRTSESVGSVVSLYNFNHANMSYNFPETRDGYILSRSYYSGPIATKNYNRIRIGIKVAANSDFRGENFYLRLSESTSYNVPGNGNLPFWNIPITFNGKSYLEVHDTAAAGIWSDWVYLPKGDINCYTSELVFKSIRGELMYYNGNGYASYTTSSSYLGREDKHDCYFTSSGSTSRALHITQFGKTNSVSKNLTSGFTNSKWHKGYIDLASITSLECLKFFTGSAAVNTGTLILDNFTVTKNKNILGPTMSYTHTISGGGSVTDEISDDYGLNKYKRIYFNQYATADNPQIVSFTFATEQDINQINFTCLTKAKAPTNYVFQYTDDETASADEPISSPKWMNFSGVIMGESSFDIGFTGSIRESRVIANNISNTVLAHRFNTATVKKVRIWIEGTIGGGLPLIDNLEIYSAEDSHEMKLIFDTTSPITSPRFVMVDDGIREKQDLVPKYNTTGSYNVMWNSDKNMMQVIDPGTDGVIYTNVIPVELFQRFMITSQALGDITYEVSFDEGDSFVEIPLERVYRLDAQTDSVVVKMTLKDDATLHALAMLYSL